MNVPFSPPLLWPVVVVIVVAAVFWRRWQKRAFLAAPAEDWPKHAPKGWKHSRIYPWLFVIAGVIGAYSLWRFSAPCVYGQVVDATTDKPVAGALVMRTISRKGPPSLAESGSIIAESFSFWTTHTGKTGHFFLPGWVSLFPFGISGTSGMTWVVYHPGLMPGRGCLSEGFTGPGGCGGEGTFTSPDPWVLVNVARHFGLTRLELRIYPPTLEGVTFQAYTGTGEIVRINTPGDADPWGEYFRRLNVLVQYRDLTIEEFVKEAKRYAKDHELTTSIYDAIYQVQQSLGGLEESGKYDRPEQALMLLGLQEEYCKRHGGEHRCAADYFEQRRSFLKQGLVSNQGITR